MLQVMVLIIVIRVPKPLKHHRILEFKQYQIGIKGNRLYESIEEIQKMDNNKHTDKYWMGRTKHIRPLNKLEDMIKTAKTEGDKPIKLFQHLLAHH